MAKPDDESTPPPSTPPAFTQTLRPRWHDDKDKIADDPEGYQAARVGKKLDQLEAEGTVLKDYTVMELRIKLQRKFSDEKSGLPTPSRQTMNRVIKHRLS